VDLVITDISEERSATFIRVTIGKLGTTLDLTGNRRTLRTNTKIRQFELGIWRLNFLAVWLDQNGYLVQLVPEEFNEKFRM
jgi:hypothetical protein